MVVLLEGVFAQGKATEAIYDPNADAHKDIAAAVAKARRDHKRVLLMFGGNWCGWCRKMYGTLQDSKVGRTLRYEYVLVKVNVPREFDKNKDIAKKYDSDIWSHGVPYLTVLGVDGKVVGQSGTKPLRAGGEVDASKVWAFLEKHKPEPVDAAAVLQAARAKARDARKMLLIHLGAPW